MSKNSCIRPDDPLPLITHSRVALRVVALDLSKLRCKLAATRLVSFRSYCPVCYRVRSNCPRSLWPTHPDGDPAMANQQPLLPFLSQFFEIPFGTGSMDQPSPPDAAVASLTPEGMRPRSALGTETLTETREQSDSDAAPVPRVVAVDISAIVDAATCPAGQMESPDSRDRPAIAAFGTETTVRKPPRHTDPDVPSLVGGPLWGARVL
jgi:hypothetical protein